MTLRDAMATASPKSVLFSQPLPVKPVLFRADGPFRNPLWNVRHIAQPPTRAGTRAHMVWTSAENGCFPRRRISD